MQIISCVKHSWYLFYFYRLWFSIHSNVPPLVSLSVFVNIYSTMIYIYYVKAGRHSLTVTVSYRVLSTGRPDLNCCIVRPQTSPHAPRPRPHSHQAIRQNYLLMAFYMINHRREPVFSVIKLEILSFEFEKLIYFFSNLKFQDRV